MFAQRTEHLIRTVVTGNLRGKHQFHELLVDVHFGMHVVKLVERGNDALPERDVRLQQAFNQHFEGNRRPDPHEDLRNLATDGHRRMLVTKTIGEARHQRVPISSQPLRGIRGQFRPCERGQQRGDHFVAHDDRGRLNRLARDRFVGISNQQDQEIGEDSGHERQHACRLQSIADAILIAGSSHRLEQQARRFEVLRRTRRGEEGCHPRADGEIFDVTQFFELANRVDAHLSRHVQAGLRFARLDPNRAASPSPCD